VRIIPVLDVMGGQVVRAVGGRRSEYRPIKSRLTKSTEPIDVAKALLEASGSDRLYVADLDAITNPNAESDLGGRLAAALPRATIWLDSGIRTRADMVNKLSHVIWRRTRLSWLVGDEQRLNVIPVLATETLSGPEMASLAGKEFGPGLVFSVDLRDGRLLGEHAQWREAGTDEDSDPLTVAKVGLSASGASHLILLDLARVGRGEGTGTERWVAQARQMFPQVEIVAGGGVRDWDDVRRLGDAGADAVLVASALHDGTLARPCDGGGLTASPLNDSH
jgi:phosphoribosylformimino-5-aminoimidazole carboxamide ribotide isomerase